MCYFYPLTKFVTVYQEVSMELVGTIKEIFPEQQISQSFKKREMVLTTDEQYPQTIMVEFTQDKGALLNNYAPGNNVKVNFNIRGREWTNPQGQVKYFTSIQGWRIEPANAPQQSGGMMAPPPPQQGMPPMPEAPFPTQGQMPPPPQQQPQSLDDDLPF